MKKKSCVDDLITPQKQFYPFSHTTYYQVFKFHQEQLSGATTIQGYLSATSSPWITVGVMLCWKAVNNDVMKVKMTSILSITARELDHRPRQVFKHFNKSAAPLLASTVGVDRKANCERSKFYFETICRLQTAQKSTEDVVNLALATGTRLD